MERMPDSPDIFNEKVFTREDIENAAVHLRDLLHTYHSTIAVGIGVEVKAGGMYEISVRLQRFEDIELVTDLIEQYVPDFPIGLEVIGLVDTTE